MPSRPPPPPGLPWWGSWASVVRILADTPIRFSVTGRLDLRLCGSAEIAPVFGLIVAVECDAEAKESPVPDFRAGWYTPNGL